MFTGCIGRLAVLCVFVTSPPGAVAHSWSGAHYRNATAGEIQVVDSALSAGQVPPVRLRSLIVSEISDAGLGLEPSGDKAIDAVMQEVLATDSGDRSEEAAGNAVRLGRGIVTGTLLSSRKFGELNVQVPAALQVVLFLVATSLFLWLAIRGISRTSADPSPTPDGE